MIPVNPIDNAGPPMEPPMLPRKRTADEAEILDERPAKIACIRAMEDLIDELGLSSSESDPLWTDESSSSYDGSDEMSTDSDDEDDNPWGWKPVQDPWSQPPPSFFIEDIDKGISGPGGPGQPPIPPTKVTIRYLAKLLRHLSAEAREGQFEDLFNQQSIIRRIEQSMLCNTSVELRGSEERGKRSIIHRFVHMLTHDNVPSQLKNREVFEIDIEQLMQEEGEDWHLLFQQYIDDCFALRDDVIICIPHIQLLSGRGRRGAEASEHLQRRINEGLLVITTADSRTFTNYMKDVTVPFETIRIADSEHKKLLEELDQRKARKHHSEAVKALYNKYHQLAENGGIPVHRAVIEAAVDFAEAKATETQIKNGELETLAAVWIERSIAEQKLVMAERNAEAESVPVTMDVLYRVYSLWTGKPISEIGSSRSGLSLQEPLNLHARLTKQVVGQDHAVEAVAEAILTVCAGMKDESAPVGAFLFLGPTGVGKTELAKAVTRELYGSEHELIRIDMSEYQEKHEVSRLIGSPPGYVGYDEGGQLTEAVKKKPNAVILLDEIDKAHEDVLTVFLQVFDEGRLTDGQGETVDFRNCLFIMTCNLYSQEIADMMREGMDHDEVLDQIEPALMRRLRPELYNRLDAVVPFNRISSEVVNTVVPIMLEKLAKELQKSQKMTLDWTQDVIDWLGKEGYSEELGLRPLKRLVMKGVRNKVARAILGGQVSKGDRVLLMVVDDDLVVTKG